MRFRPCAAAALLLALAACSKHHPTAPVPVAVVPAGPAPSSAAGVVERLAWTWTRRDTAAYSALFTDDYSFRFAANDSAGSLWPGNAWTIEDEIQSVDHLFAGGFDLPPASDVVLTLDRPLVASPDPRPGRDPGWHRTVRTHVDLKVTVTFEGTPSVTPVTGYALFYVVRGDSAVLSAARLAAGGRDSTRWYVERWDDQTVGTRPGLDAVPTRNATWGSLKSRYW